MGFWEPNLANMLEVFWVGGGGGVVWKLCSWGGHLLKKMSGFYFYLLFDFIFFFGPPNSLHGSALGFEFFDLVLIIVNDCDC